MALNELPNVRLYQTALDTTGGKSISFPLLNFTHNSNYGAISMKSHGEKGDQRESMLKEALSVP